MFFSREKHPHCSFSPFFEAVAAEGGGKNLHTGLATKIVDNYVDKCSNCGQLFDGCLKTHLRMSMA